MKVYSLALVAIISTTGCQAFSPVSLTGQSKAARHVIFRPRQPLFAEEAPQAPIVKVMDPPPPPPVVKIMDPPAPAPAAAVVVPPPAPAMPAPVSTTPPPATTAQAVELEELRTELKEAEKQNEEIKQEMKAMESKVEKMESQVEKITTEATKPAPAPTAPTTPPPPPKPTPEELRAKAEDEARKEKLRKEAEVAAKKVQDEKARLQKAEDEKKALVDKLNSVRKTDAVKKDLKPSLPRTIPFDPNASTTNNNNNNVMTMMKPPALPNFDPSSVTKEKATIAGGILGALVLGRFVLSSREEVKDEAATKRQTKSIRSTIAIKDASGKPKKEKASTRIAKAAAKVANKQLEKKGESAPTKSASAPAPAPASTTGSTTSTPAPVPVPVPVPAPPTASSTTPSSGSAQKSVSNNGGSYLDSLGGSKSSSSAVKSSYSPFGSKPKAAVTSNNFMYTPPGVNPTTPSTPAKENKHQETPPMAASSYAPFGANDAPPKNASPFDSSSSNGVSSPPPYSPPPPAQNETPAAPSQQQQQQQQQSPLPPPKGNTAGKTSYLPYGKKPQGKPWWNSPK